MKRARIMHFGEERIVAVDEDGRPLADGKPVEDTDFDWGPPVFHSVICAALNDRRAYDALAPQFQQAPYRQAPQQPFFFIKPANTITSHNAPVQFPNSAEELVCAGALAVVIGKQGFRIPAAQAFEHIKGYTLFNDFSLPERSFFRPPVREKGFDSFGPLGPVLLDRDQLTDLQGLTVNTIINGERKQTWRTADLIHDIPTLITRLSDFMTLHENDVIVPGFPHPRPTVQAGDEVIVESDPIGGLASYIVMEDDYYAEWAYHTRDGIYCRNGCYAGKVKS